MKLKELGQYPIDAHLLTIGDALVKANTCLIKAEPGAGKTTRVPIHLLSVIKGEILVLEPRRLAARLSAERSAWFLGQSCGQTVGYRIRQDSNVSKETRLTFITEGLFSRILRDNPNLDGIGAVILDEFHERNIHTDIALALVRKLQEEKRSDLRLVVMSATLDTQQLETYLENAAVFDVEGKVFPVEVEFQSQMEDYGQKKVYREDVVAEAVKRMTTDKRCPGNILVFLTGMGEIMQCKRTVEKVLSQRDFTVLPLAADVPFNEQQRVFQQDGTRKIVLSTNVAETSLTIPGVTGVIDTGLAKIPAHAPWSGMPTLEIKRISQASAIQRGGRAGRTAPGVVYRLYSKPEFLNREQFTPPDIQRIDISHALLEVMNLGYSPDLMPWFQPPDETNMESAQQLLTYLGAVTPAGELTALGKELSALPLHPRLAAVAVAGREAGCPEDALLAACLISENFVLRRDVVTPGHDEEGELCDVSMQLDLIKAAHHKQNDLSPYPFVFMDLRRRQRITELYRSLAKPLRLAPVPPPHKTDRKQIALCLLRGFPDRVAKRRDLAGKKKKGMSALYTFALGRGGMVGKGSFVFNEKPEFLVAVDAVEDLKSDAAKGVTIRACASVPLETLKLDPAGLIREERREEFEQKGGAFTVWQDLYYGKLKIESKRGNSLETDGDLSDALAANWPYPFENDDPLKIYHRRVALLNQYGIPNNCPVFEGEMLELFFQCICEDIQSLKELLDHSLAHYIDRQLSEGDRQILKTYTPLKMKLKNGIEVKINYPEDKEPWVETQLQNCFGLREHPGVILGKHPLVFHLLGPNRRAAQVTDNLPRFWSGSYAEVRKELSRRYPKHYWPETPATAEPVRLKKFL